MSGVPSLADEDDVDSDIVAMPGDMEEADGPRRSRLRKEVTFPMPTPDEMRAWLAFQAAARALATAERAFKSAQAEYLEAVKALSKAAVPE